MSTLINNNSSSNNNNNNSSSSSNNNIKNENNITQTTTTNTTTKNKKIFTPNIPKQRIKNNNNNNNNEFLTPERIINPTKFEIESRNKDEYLNRKLFEEIDRELQIEKEIKKLQKAEIQQYNKSLPPTATTTGGTTTATITNKPVILKIKRKIDDDALPSILIERPKKKAFLDSFKDFGINGNEDDKDKDDHQLPNDIEQKQEQQQQDEQNSPKPQEKQEEKDKKLFTLITTLDDPAGSSKLLTKFQKRLEEFNQMGLVSSPKLLDTKREKTIKKRKESRYKQINTNRNLLSKEERELFQDHDVIELERTILDPNNLLGSTLSKEDEAMISDYRSLLDEHLGGSSSGSKPMEVKYVYDYYYFNPSIDQQLQLSRLHQENPDSIETVTLPPEDDFYDILDGGASDNSSVDSENWYREYPSSEDDSDGYDDFDDYHGFNKSKRKSNSDDEYEVDEYEIDGDYYDEDDYDDEI